MSEDDDLSRATWPTPRDIRDFDWVTLPPSTRLHTFDALSGTLAAAEWGLDDGTPVLALPGVTGSKEDFALVGPLLARAGYHVVAVDLAGQYQSHAAGPRPGGKFDLALHLADAEALLDVYGPAHVIGYSFAGEVATQLVVRRRVGLEVLGVEQLREVQVAAVGEERSLFTEADVVGRRGAPRLHAHGRQPNRERGGP